MNITTELEVAGVAVDVVIDCDYTPASPGKYSGPWEDCYPAEPEEIIVNSIVSLRENVGLTSLLAIDKIYATISEICLDYIRENE